MESKVEPILPAKVQQSPSIAGGTVSPCHERWQLGFESKSWGIWLHLFGSRSCPSGQWPCSRLWGVSSLGLSLCDLQHGAACPAGSRLSAFLSERWRQKLLLWSLGYPTGSDCFGALAFLTFFFLFFPSSPGHPWFFVPFFFFTLIRFYILVFYKFCILSTYICSWAVFQLKQQYPKAGFICS